MTEEQKNSVWQLARDCGLLTAPPLTNEFDRALFALVEKVQQEVYAQGRDDQAARDYFAAKAMAAPLESAVLPEESWPDMLPMVARFAYAMADAMLNAREVQS